MFTNRENISLIMSVWLATDNYDHQYDANTYSVSELLQPIRSIVLSRRLKANNNEAPIDLMDVIPSRIGSAVHSAVEKAWEKFWVGLKNIGIPEKVIQRVHLNDTNQDDPDGIYIYIEHRASKQIDDFILTGKFDFVEQGTVRDIKTTKAYNWMTGDNNQKYAMQGSMYRLLNPVIITDDHMSVEFIFTDWSAADTFKENYPPKKMLSKRLPLMSIGETEQWVQNKVTQIRKLESLPQEQLPRCTPKELWQKKSIFAYYTDPHAQGKSNKNFDTRMEAMSYRSSKGNVGRIDERLGEPVFCNYCKARTACTQAAGYINAGILKI
jgi:hypothetical protein